MKAKKLIPRWDMNRLSEGHKVAVDKIWDRMAKNGLSGQNRDFGSKKLTS